MGSGRHGDDQHQRKGFVPEVTLAGSIEATCAGQEMVIDFLRDRIVFRLPNLQSARKLRQSPTPDPVLLARLLQFSEQRVLVKIGNMKEQELFPKPSWIVRLLSPQLRRLANVRLRAQA